MMGIGEESSGRVDGIVLLRRGVRNVLVRGCARARHPKNSRSTNSGTSAKKNGAIDIQNPGTARAWSCVTARNATRATSYHRHLHEIRRVLALRLARAPGDASGTPCPPGRDKGGSR